MFESLLTIDKRSCQDWFHGKGGLKFPFKTEVGLCCFL